MNHLRGQFSRATIRQFHAGIVSNSAAQGNLPMSPAARYLITNLHLDPANLHGTGKHGMITKEDITKFIQGGGKAQASQPVAAAAQPAPAVAAPAAPAVAAPTSSVDPVNSQFKDIPNNNMRKVIAKRLTESKSQVPHYYTSIEVNVDAVLNLRKKLKKDYDLNVSVNDFVIKAAALALRDVPEANAKWNPEAKAVVPSPAVDISVAVATPNGLITPILTQADRRSLVEINKTVKDLATRARDGKLKPEEFQGGSFSISNLGMYGVSSFTAVINPPQACILAVGAGHSRVLPPSAAAPDKLRVVNTVTVQMSADRRVIDEALAGQFLQAFRGYLSDTTAISL